jgi:hypothetical protein
LLLDPQNINKVFTRYLPKPGNGFIKKHEFKIKKGVGLKIKQKYFPVVQLM